MKSLLELDGVKALNRKEQYCISGGGKVWIIGYPPITTGLYTTNNGEREDNSDDANE